MSNSFGRPRPGLTFEDVRGRVWEDLERGCWHWAGTIQAAGYGVVRIAKRQVRAHRLFYEQLVGPIPAGMFLDHLCHNRDCVRPLHLEPVTPGENIRKARRRP